MKNIITISLSLIISFSTLSCSKTEGQDELNQKDNTNDYNLLSSIPKGFELFEKVKGDLNKDGIDDYVLIIKSIQNGGSERNSSGELVNRNRRGIIILFNNNDTYTPIINNLICFSSENEDGGVYFAPELSVSIENNNLLVSYSHGRYGYWSYTFRYQNSDFELIGYDKTSGAPVTENEISINFLTKKLIEKVNTNENAQGGDEIFKETTKNIRVLKTTKLSEITNFDDFDLPYTEVRSNAQVGGVYTGEDNLGLESTLVLHSNGTLMIQASVGDGSPSYGRWTGSAYNLKLYINHMGSNQLLGEAKVTEEGLRIVGGKFYRRQ